MIFNINRSSPIWIHFSLAIKAASIMASSAIRLHYKTNYISVERKHSVVHLLAANGV